MKTDELFVGCFEFVGCTFCMDKGTPSEGENVKSVESALNFDSGEIFRWA